MTPRELKRMMAAVAALSADEIETVKKALSVREGQVVKSAVEQARMASGASQDSCRLIHAANRVLFSAWRSRMTASRSGLSVTGPTGDQSRVFPDQRAGLSSRAWRYV